MSFGSQKSMEKFTAEKAENAEGTKNLDYFSAHSAASAVKVIFGSMTPV